MTKYKPESDELTAEKIGEFCHRFLEGKIKVGEPRSGAEPACASLLALRAQGPRLPVAASGRCPS